MHAILLPFLLSCTPTRVSTVDYGPIVSQALQVGGVIARMQRDIAVENQDYVACLVFSGVSTALATGKAAVDEANGTFQMPAVEIDIAECLPFGASLEPVDTGYVGTLAGMILDSVQAVLDTYADTACSEWAVASARVGYARGIVDAVFQELENPDGRVTLPGSQGSLSSCR